MNVPHLVAPPAHEPGPPVLLDHHDFAGIAPIEWADFWADAAPAVEWVLEPFVPAGRQVAIFSAAKEGKSLVALDGCAALATGRSVFGATPTAPAHVVYIDLEMTAADLRERLVDLGYGPGTDLHRLSYYQLTDLPALDTDLGGQILESIARRHRAVLVVLDTMARAVSGEENHADTYRAFYRHTGRRLKATGVALLRLDHAGKEQARGQRGSSSKADDVDVVFRLNADGPRLAFTRTHSRVPWVPAEVIVAREDEPRLRHVLAAAALPAGTQDTAAILDSLHVPLDATVDTATAALKTAGKGRRRAAVMAALKYRRQRP